MCKNIASPESSVKKSLHVSILFLFLTFLCFVKTRAQNTPVLETHWWQTNGLVKTIARSGNTVYLGGEFSHLAPSIEPYGTAVKKTDGLPLDYLNPNGAVNAAIPDGSGGWFIGGEFTEVGGQPRNRIAQLDSAGQLTGFAQNMGANGGVYDLWLNGSTLYVGGKFSGIGTNSLVSSNYLNGSAFVGPAANANAPAYSGFLGNAVRSIAVPGGGWIYTGNSFGLECAIIKVSPNGTETLIADLTNGSALKMEISNNILYIGGFFSEIRQVSLDSLGQVVVADQQNRNNLGAIDISTGAIQAWNPNANSVVYDLDIHNNTVYLAGAYDSIGGQPRVFLSSVDAITGAVSSWNPSPTYNVNAVAIAGNKIFAAGSSAAAYDISTGIQTAWNPDPDAEIKNLLPAGDNIIASGYFGNIGGQQRKFLVALDTTDGLASAWNPNPDDVANALSLKGDTLYVGGSFTSIAGQNTGTAAAFRLSSGTLLPWTPNPNGSISQVCTADTTILLLGNYTGMGGQPRNRLAAYNISSGTLSTWNPVVAASVVDVSSFVNTMVLSNNTLYVGGAFNAVGGQVRNNLAAVDAVSGALLSWNPDANSDVYDMAVNGNTVFVAGIFNAVGGQARNKIASIDAVSGALTAWDPDADNTVNTLTYQAGMVYAGGDFTTIGGTARSRLAAIDASTGLPGAWNPNASGGNNTRIYDLAIDGSTIYAVGDFDSIGSLARKDIAAIELSTGQPTPWVADAKGFYGFTVSSSGNKVYIGGDLSAIGGKTRNHLVALDAVTGQATSWNPDANEPVNKIVCNGNAVYVAGTFSEVNGQSRNKLACIDAVSAQLTLWNPQLNQNAQGVNDMEVSGNEIFLAGKFDSISGQARKNLAAVDALTGQVNAWNPQANGLAMFDILSDGNALYVAGSFDTIAGQARNNLAAVTIATAAALPWNPDANDEVYKLTSDGQRIFAAGAFTFIGGQSRNMLACMDTNAGLANAWNPAAEGTSATALALKSNNLLTYGGFTTIGGQSATTGLVELDTATALATPWNPDFSGWYSIADILVQNGKIYLGGSFEGITGLPRNNFAVLSYSGISGVSSSFSSNTCAGASGTVSFTADGAFDAGNAFTAQLSDAQGNFVSPVTIGTLTATASGNINVTIPGGTPAGNAYRIRVVSSSPASTGPDNGLDISITPSIFPVISISATQTSICAGSNVSFTASTTGEGNTPVFQWRVNGIPAGNNSPVFSTTSLANNDVVSCTLTSNAACASPLTVTSNNLVITVNTALNPSVTVQATPGTNVCQGSVVNFFAIPVNGGISPAYQWRINGVNVLGETSDHFSYQYAGTGNAVSVIMASSLTCALGAVVSAPLSVNVNPSAFGLSVSANNTLVSPPYSVAFSNNTPNASGYVFTWNFGDGTQYIGQTPPPHVYPSQGSYSLSLFAYDPLTSCTDSLFLPGYIQCTGGTPGFCNYTLSMTASNNGQGCAGGSVRMVATTNAPNPLFQWSLNGSPIGGETDDTIFAHTPGTYAVNVLASDGCLLTVTGTPIGFGLPALPAPVVTVSGALQACQAGLSTLIVQGNYSNYLWSNGSTGSSITTGSGGIYQVTVSNAQGCTALSDPIVLNASVAEAPQICLSTVDASGNNFVNVIIWEKPLSNQIDSFFVFKETIPGVFQKIGAKAYTDSSIFRDPTTNPALVSEKYRLVVLDTCGGLSLPGYVHETMHLQVMPGNGNSRFLSWNASQGLNVEKYIIESGPSLTQFTPRDSVPSWVNIYLDAAPAFGNNTYYRVVVRLSQPCSPGKSLQGRIRSTSNGGTNNISIAFDGSGTSGFHALSNPLCKARALPNPSSGSFRLVLADNTPLPAGTLLRLSDVSGREVYAGKMGADSFVELTGVQSGSYSLNYLLPDGSSGMVRLLVVKNM